MFLILHFADDTSVFLDGSNLSLETTLQDLNDFKIMSGLAVNYTKSQAIWIGSKWFCSEKLVNNTDLVWGSKNFPVLGIEFDIDLEQMFTANYNKRPTGLNGHLSIRDFTLTSCQKGSYLYINSPIIE